MSFFNRRSDVLIVPVVAYTVVQRYDPFPTAKLLSTFGQIAEAMSMTPIPDQPIVMLLLGALMMLLPPVDWRPLAFCT